MKKIETWDFEQLAAQVIIPRLDFDLFETDTNYKNSIIRLVNRGIGGFCIFNGSPEVVEKITSYLQSLAEVPLIFCADFEYGLPMRLTEGTSFPHSMAIAKSEMPEYAYKVGKAIAAEAKQIGINWNLAPVADINNNPDNPVINIRSFGDDPAIVSNFALNYARGTQEEKVLACAKHFPGHGDTNVDSHLELPILDIDFNRLESFELLPFRDLIEQDVKSIMVGHLSVPALDDSNLPATLSPKVIKFLREYFGYKGIIITDALDMKALTNNFSQEKIAEMVFLAGNDIALMPKNPEEFLDCLIKIIQNNEEIKNNIIFSIYKIVKMKRWAGLIPYYAKNETNPNAFLSHLNLALKIALDGIKLDGNRALIPLDEQINFASLAFLQKEKDFQSASRFFTMLAQATENDCDFGYVNFEISEEDILGFEEGMKNANLFIIALFYKSVAYHGSVNIEPKLLDVINRISRDKKVVLLNFGNPYLNSNISADLYINMFSDSFASLAASIVKITGRDSLVKI